MLCFFHATPTTAIYTLSLHDALPISRSYFLAGGTTYSKTRTTFCTPPVPRATSVAASASSRVTNPSKNTDRKSTRLNSSHLGISYAVFCLKKKTARYSVIHSPISDHH